MSPSVECSKIHVDIVMAEGFVLTEFSAIVEVLRIANRVTAKDWFSWNFRSKTGGCIGCRAGITTDTQPIPKRADADYVFILGNSDPDATPLSLRREIQAYRWGGAGVFLLSEAASRYIFETGEQLSNHTTHWENRALLNERGTPGVGSYALAADDGKITTSAGMGATYDLVLDVLSRHISAASVATVADIFLHETVRIASTLQPFGGKKLSNTGQPALDKCLALMQANIEDPLKIRDLVERLSISQRSLERHFKTFLDTTPNAYYRELRLNHANSLLQKTSMSISDVALACGFYNGFSTVFHRHFGVKPTAVRKGTN
jgi:transcriptional regulator GlxA family with amidase domain